MKNLCGARREAVHPGFLPHHSEVFLRWARRALGLILPTQSALQTRLGTWASELAERGNFFAEVVAKVLAEMLAEVLAEKEFRAAGK